MALSYMARKLSSGEMSRDLGEISSEIKGWGELKGMPHRQLLLHLYKTMLPFLRTDIGDEVVTFVNLMTATMLYSGFAVFGAAYLSWPLIGLSLMFWLLHLLLYFSRDKQAPAPYSFGRPRPTFQLFFGRHFRGWAYVLIYEPLLALLPMLLAIGAYLVAITAEHYASAPAISGWINPMPLVLFFGFHLFVLLYTPWWLFADESEVELEKRAAVIQQQQDEKLQERFKHEAARRNHATARRR